MQLDLQIAELPSNHSAHNYLSSMDNPYSARQACGRTERAAGQETGVERRAGERGETRVRFGEEGKKRKREDEERGATKRGILKRPRSPRDEETNGVQVPVQSEGVYMDEDQALAFLTSPEVLQEWPFMSDLHFLVRGA
jgi:hypothetical protein